MNTENGLSFICTLSDDEQNSIRDLLVLVGISGDDLERAMNSRVCDLLDIVMPLMEA